MFEVKLTCDVCGKSVVKPCKGLPKDDALTECATGAGWAWMSDVPTGSGNQEWFCPECVAKPAPWKGQEFGHQGISVLERLDLIEPALDAALVTLNRLSGMIVKLTDPKPPTDVFVTRATDGR